MQTDIWLTQPAQPTQCPLCSKPLRASSKTCYACGFSLESPKSTGSSVWIDPAVYTYQPPESTTTNAQSAETSKALPNPPKSVKPTGSVVWEGNGQAQGPHPSTQPSSVPTSQSQPQTRQRTGSISNPSLNKHTSPVSKSVAKPLHTRRRTYTRSLSQTQDAYPSARPPADQPPMWQYESPNFEAGSSLPALSLLVAETPTQPGIALPEVDIQQSAFQFSSVPPEDSWIVGTVEADISTSLPDSPPWAAPRTRHLPDIADLADVAAIDEIDTVPPLLARRLHKVPADDSFLISGSSLVSDAISAAEPTEGTQRSLRNAFQSPWASTSHTQIDEVDTAPELNQAPAPSRTPEASHRPYACVDEIDTAPEMIKTRSAEQTPQIPYAHVDQIDTLPELNQARSRALVPINAQVAAIPATDSSSWTAGGSARSSYARHIAYPSRRKKRYSSLSLNPFDSVRWWLLRPGRIEFLLWLGGTILLISITCVLLLVTAFSLNWITPGLRSSVTSSPSSLTNTATQGRVLPTVTGSPGLIFKLLDKGPLLPGQPIHVHGEGFTSHGKVVFTLDDPQLPPNPAASVQADAHGEFTTTLSLGYGLARGLHLIIAHDIKTGSVAVLSFTIAQSPFGKGATATPVPVTPGATVTPQPGKPGSSPTPAPTSIGTPVGIGVSPTPTTGTTPTPTPTQTPTPTPTPGKTPTPTPGTTPTPKPSPTAAIPPAPSPTPSSSPTAAVPLSSTLSGDSGPGGGLSNALGNSNTPALSAQLTRLAPWLWLPMLFYILSMLMLGLAGVLYRRRR